MYIYLFVFMYVCDGGFGKVLRFMCVVMYVFVFMFVYMYFLVVEVRGGERG